MMVNTLHRKKRMNDGFSVSKLEISMLQTRNTENRPKKYENVELQALLDEDSQTQKQLAEQLSVNQQVVSNLLREMEKIQKVGRWMPHELNERQMERRKNTCEILLERYRRKFLHIVTGDEKWIFFENPKRKKSWIDPGAPSTSTARPNRFDRKTMLCVWWDQKNMVYYELLKPGETVNTKRYQQQLIDLNRSLLKKRPEYQKRQQKLYDNVPSHTAKSLRHVGSTQLGSSTPCGLFTRLGSFRLPLVCIDESRTC